MPDDCTVAQWIVALAKHPIDAEISIIGDIMQDATVYAHYPNGHSVVIWDSVEGFKEDSKDVSLIYLRGLSEDRGYYADQAETSGLKAVYEAGLSDGRKSLNA